LHDFANVFLAVYAALFPIVNPLGLAPIYLGMTRDYPPPMRHMLARRIAVNGFLLLLGSLLIGSHILEFFDISVAVVRVAGGLVVTSMGWQLLRQGDDVKARKRLETISETRAVQEAFYPLTMPLTVGPGSIAVAITLGSKRPPDAHDLAHLSLVAAAAILGLAAIALTIFVCFRFAENLESALGEALTNVFVRLSAFILLCIGIEILWSGYSALVAGG